jgi:hypothetical protein
VKSVGEGEASPGFRVRKVQDSESISASSGSFDCVCRKERGKLRSG